MELIKQITFSGGSRFIPIRAPVSLAIDNNPAGNTCPLVPIAMKTSHSPQHHKSHPFLMAFHETNNMWSQSLVCTLDTFTYDVVDAHHHGINNFATHFTT